MLKLNNKLVTSSTVVLTAMQLIMVPISVSAATNSTNSSNGGTDNTSSIKSLDNTDSSELAKKFGIEGNLVKTNKVTRGDSVTFDNFFIVGNDEEMKSLSLVDPLNTNFSYDSARVLLSQPVDNNTKAAIGNKDNNTDNDDNTSAKKQDQSNVSDPQKYKTVDVSKTGKFTFDKSNHTITWKADKPSQYFGQLIDLQVTVKVNTDTDLNDIPNQSYMLKNDDKTETNKVDVTLDAKETPAPEIHTPKTAKPSTPAPATKYAKVGSLPQTMQKVAKQHPFLVLTGVGMVIAGFAGLYKFLKQRKEGNN